MADDNWPKRADGSNKTMGEMTREEQMVQWRRAAARFKARIERPEAQAAFARVFASDAGGSTR